jgi:hypothetical protein
MITVKARRVLRGFRHDGLLRRGAWRRTRPVVFVALIGLVASVMTAGSFVLPAGAGAAGSSVGATDGQFVAITPTRVLDTRVGLGAPKALVGGGSSVTVAVTGQDAIPTSGVAAVAVNVTVVSPRAVGAIIVYGHSLPRPATSNLNFAPGQTVADMVIVTPGADGKVDLFNFSTAGANLLVDISGYYRTGAAAAPGGYTPVAPVRVLDTRIGLGAPKALVGGRSTLAVAVTGRARVPTSGVAAIAVTVTVLGPRAAGAIIVYGHSLPRPATSNLNFAPGQSIADMVIVTPGADGKVDLFNCSAAGANLLVDISGYYRAAPAGQPGGYSPISPVRVLDTRAGLGAAKALVSGGSSVPVAVTGRAGVPTSGVAAVVLTVSVVGPRTAGFLSVFGHSLPRPATSTLNFAAGQTVANLVVAVPGADGKVDLFNGAAGGANLLVDVTGYYVAPDQYASSQGGPGQTFDNPSETALTPATAAGLRPAWNTIPNLTSNSTEPPALVDGVAYIVGRIPGQDSGAFEAVDAQTGQTLWTVSIPNCIVPQEGVTISAGMAFMGCNATGGPTGPYTLVAISLSSHQQVWSRDHSGPVGVADGMVFADQADPSGLNHWVLGLDAYTGQIRYQTPSADGHGMTWAAKDGQLVIASGIDFKVYNDATGALLWTGVGSQMQMGLTLDAGHILGLGPGILSEWSEGGCGKATCAANWTILDKVVNDPRTCVNRTGGADGHTIAMTVMCSDAGVDHSASHIVLVDEDSGAIVNTIPMPAGQMVSTGAVRSGNLLWVPGGRGYTASYPYPTGIEAFNADCTTNCQPVVDLVGNQFMDSPFPSFAVAGGTVLIQTPMLGEVLAYHLS